jgi:hypothetical protein
MCIFFKKHLLYCFLTMCIVFRNASKLAGQDLRPPLELHQASSERSGTCKPTIRCLRRSLTSKPWHPERQSKLCSWKVHGKHKFEERNFGTRILFLCRFPTAGFKSVGPSCLFPLSEIPNGDKSLGFELASLAFKQLDQ